MELLFRMKHMYHMRHIYSNFRTFFMRKRAKRCNVKNNLCNHCPRVWKKDNYIWTIDKKAWEWLKNIPSPRWSKAYFCNRVKNDSLLNNLNESLNVMIMEAKSLPTSSMFEKIRIKLIKIFNIKRFDINKYGRPIYHNI